MQCVICMVKYGVLHVWASAPRSPYVCCTVKTRHEWTPYVDGRFPALFPRLLSGEQEVYKETITSLWKCTEKCRQYAGKFQEHTPLFSSSKLLPRFTHATLWPQKVLQHKLALIRGQEGTAKEFRTLFREITFYLG